MGYYYYFVYGLQVCLLLVVAAGSSSSSSSHVFISGYVLKDQRYSGRNLLQVLRKCPVSFEFANYTILTSKCKGPDYPKKQCCAALGDFACPYAEYINDASYDCSASMFAYIETQTTYPRGLFASECHEDIPCPGDSPSSSPAADASAAADDDALFFVIPQSLIFVLTLLLSVWILFSSS